MNSTTVNSRRIGLFDTTLRDGEQAPGNAMNATDKLDLASRIADLGVDCVEAGFPASSPSDFEATQLISAHLADRTRFATFSRTLRGDVETAVRAGGTHNHEVQMVATGSQIHLDQKRGISRVQSAREIEDTVAFARSLGIQHISVGIEDASRGDDELVRRLTEIAVDAGATCIILADTTGCHTPAEYGELVAKVRQWAPRPIRLSTHCHNDFGLSLANALAGLSAGADEVQVTLGGIGERAGNTPLEELAAVLSYKSSHYNMHTDIKLDEMYSVYNVLRRVIGLDEPRNKPIFGSYVFGTAAGIHQQGLISNPETYEFVEPAKFGRERSMMIARHSGRAVIRHLINELGVSVSDNEVDELYRTHVSSRAGGDLDDLDTVRARLVADLSVDAGAPVLR